MSMNRRTVLELGLLALAGQMMGCQNPTIEAGADRINQTRKDLESARAVGQLWLDAHGSKKKPSVNELVQALTHGAPPEAKALTEWLRARHVKDLEEGRTTEAMGWVLSQTEARIYALAALS